MLFSNSRDIKDATCLHSGQTHFIEIKKCEKNNAHILFKRVENTNQTLQAQ